MSHFSAPVNNYMSSPVYSVDSTTQLTDVHAEMTSRGVSSLAVMGDEGEIGGVVTRTDLLKVGRRQAGSLKSASLLTFPSLEVGKAMTTGIVTVKSDDSIEHAAQTMLKNGYHRIYVEDQGKIVGILSTRDIMLVIAQQRLNKPISAFMSTPAFTVRSHEPISLASERLAKAHVSGLIVVDEGWPVGLFTQTVALTAKDMPQDTHTEAVMDTGMLLLAPETPIFRAAEQASAMDVRRVVAWDGKDIKGILTGLDFAKAATPVASNA